MMPQMIKKAINYYGNAKFQLRETNGRFYVLRTKSAFSSLTKVLIQDYEYTMKVIGNNYYVHEIIAMQLNDECYRG